MCERRNRWSIKELQKITKVCSLQNMTKMYTLLMIMVLSGRNPMTAIMKMSLLLNKHPTWHDIFGTL
jgi:hypothetical protein